jgi:hypothetical protein
VTALRALDKPRPAPRTGLYLDAQFRQARPRRRRRSAARRDPSHVWFDTLVAVLLGAGLATSLLLAAAVLLGAAWLTVFTARAVMQLVGGW